MENTDQLRTTSPSPMTPSDNDKENHPPPFTNFYTKDILVRGHLRAPTSQTEYVHLTTPDKLRLADTPYIPPHHRRPHLSPLIASLFRPPLTN